MRKQRLEKLTTLLIGTPYESTPTTTLESYLASNKWSSHLAKHALIRDERRKDRAIIELRDLLGQEFERTLLVEWLEKADWEVRLAEKLYRDDLRRRFSYW